MLPGQPASACVSRFLGSSQRGSLRLLVRARGINHGWLYGEIAVLQVKVVWGAGFEAQSKLEEQAARKPSEQQTQVTTRMNLKCMVLNEGSQARKATYAAWGSIYMMFCIKAKLCKEKG